MELALLFKTSFVETGTSPVSISEWLMTKPLSLAKDRYATLINGYASTLDLKMTSMMTFTLHDLGCYC